MPRALGLTFAAAALIELVISNGAHGAAKTKEIPPNDALTAVPFSHSKKKPGNFKSPSATGGMVNQIRSSTIPNVRPSGRPSPEFTTPQNFHRPKPKIIFGPR